MQDADIRFLKRKCNLLIEKALQLEQEKKNNELKICRLKEEKRTLEAALKKASPERISFSDMTQQDVEPIRQTSVEESQYDPPEAAAEEENREQLKQRFEVAVSPPGNLSRERETVSPETILTMIQSLSAQLDNQPREEIVIRRLSAGGKLLELAADILGKIVKGLVLGGIMLLLSLAATVLLNQDLRNMFLTFIRSCIG